MLAIRSTQNDRAVFVMLAGYAGYHSALSNAIGSAPVARRAVGRQADVTVAASHLLASDHRKESVGLLVAAHHSIVGDSSNRMC
jgi:hypothetical protein